MATLGAQRKQQIFRMILDSFRHSSCASHMQCLNKYCNFIYVYYNVDVSNSTEWIGSIPIPLFVGDVAPQSWKSQDWNVRYVIPHQYVLRCVMLS